MPLNHFDAAGNAIMVDVSQKADTVRQATAAGRSLVSSDCFEAIRSGTAKKGDVLGVARVAGIMATKRTSELIPLCHPLPITKVSVEFALLEELPGVEAVCTASCTGKTGVEMEALTGCTVALLTIYDMCKAMDRGMTLTGVYLREKDGGKSGRIENAVPRGEAR